MGSPILAIRAFGSDNVDFVLCNYNEINEKVKEFTATEQFNHYDRVFITDISVNEEVAELIDYSEARCGAKDKYQLLDHHSTATWLNKYPWAFVASEYIEGKNTSGTSLFYDWMVVNGFIEKEDWNAAQFTELVRVYDTWEWDRDQNMQAKKLNDLLYIVGQSRFIKRFSEDIDPVFTDSEELILEIERNTIENYIKKKEKEVWKVLIDGKKALGIFAEKYISELGNTIAKNNPDIDLVVIIDAGSGRVSYRTVKEDVNVAEIARKYGGGGHPKSSGSTFDRGLSCSWLHEIFEDEV